MAKDAGVKFDIGTAPLPVADDQADDYGKGFLSGTVMGIARTSKKQNAAWELVKYMTTDTDAVVSFANAIHNVPSTFAALKSPDAEGRPGVQDLPGHRPEPELQHPAGLASTAATYQTTLQDFGYQYESGKAKDLKAGLKKTADADRHGHRAGEVAPMSHAVTPALRQAPPVGAAHGSPSCRPG